MSDDDEPHSLENDETRNAMEWPMNGEFAHKIFYLCSF